MILYYYFLSQDKYQNLTYIPSLYYGKLGALNDSFNISSFNEATCLWRRNRYFRVILTVMSTNALFEALIAVLIVHPLWLPFYLRESEEREDDI